MGRVAYLILSHANVSHGVRLVRTIRAQSPASVVVIHHDASRVSFPRSDVADDSNVLVVDEWIAGAWGDFSLVRMVFAGIETLRKHAIAYDWLVLLSGMDYPIRSLAEFESQLAASGDGMLGIDPAPGALLDRYRFAWYRLPRVLENRIAHELFGVLSRVRPLRRFMRFQSGRVGCRFAFAKTEGPSARGMTIYRGRQWWALSKRAVAYAVAYVDENPRYVRWFEERAMIPDEAFFHTMLANATGFAFRNDDGRFLRWDGPGGASAAVLTSRDLPAMIASGKFFARKFDVAADGAVLDALDEIIGVRALQRR